MRPTVTTPPVTFRGSLVRARASAWCLKDNHKYRDFWVSTRKRLVPTFAAPPTDRRAYATDLTPQVEDERYNVPIVIFCVNHALNRTQRHSMRQVSKRETYRFKIQDVQDTILTVTCNAKLNVNHMPSLRKQSHSTTFNHSSYFFHLICQEAMTTHKGTTLISPTKCATLLL